MVGRGGGGGGFFFNDTATTEIYTLSLHDALPIYDLLQSGSALGFGCGPLLISKEPYTREDVLSGKLKIGIPGTYTTANLLLNFYAPNVPNREEMLFHEIKIGRAHV